MDQYRSWLLTNRPFHGLWCHLGWRANKTNRTIHWIEIYPMDSVIHLLNNWAQHCWKKPLNSVYLPIFLLKTNEDMVCKIVKFFIDACIVEPQFVSPNIQISVCKILQSFIFAGFRWQVHEFEGALKLSSSVTGNSHSVIKTRCQSKLQKMKGSTLAFSMNMHFSNLFYSILDLFVLINTP